jgi:hypothetical protein
MNDNYLGLFNAIACPCIIILQIAVAVGWDGNIGVASSCQCSVFVFGIADHLVAIGFILKTKGEDLIIALHVLAIDLMVSYGQLEIDLALNKVVWTSS